MRSNLTTGQTQTTATDPALEDDAKTMPLGVGDFADDTALDPLAGAGERRKINSSSLIVVVVIAIACTGLWIMRTLTQVKASTGQTTDIEATIEKFLSGVKSDGVGAGGVASGSTATHGAGVLAVLTESYTERQVPLEAVQRNPFILPVEQTAPGVPVADTGDKQRAERQANIQKAGSRFELKSIIMGSQPLASISGKIVRIGDELVAEPEKIVFRVQEITGDFVTLSAHDENFNLTVEVTLVQKRDR